MCLHGPELLLFPQPEWIRLRDETGFEINEFKAPMLSFIYYQWGVKLWSWKIYIHSFSLKVFLLNSVHFIIPEGVQRSLDALLYWNVIFSIDYE